MTLRATTCLGDNTTPMLLGLVASLKARGVDIEFDDSLDHRSRQDGFRNGDFDLVWACGLLTAQAVGHLDEHEIIAAPVFSGELGPVYRSVVVTISEGRFESLPDVMSGRLAVNEFGSWSGFVGFDRWLAERGESIDAFRTTVLTGAHRNSAMAVADGSADVAAIDHTVFDHITATEPWSADLEEFARTDDWPSPPFTIRTGAIDPDMLIEYGREDAGALMSIVSASSGDYEFMVAQAEKSSHKPATE